MTKTFTLDDLVRFLYDEMDKGERLNLENALLCNQELLDCYTKLSEIKAQLDQLLEDPSERVINNILTYSKSFNLHPIN